MEKHILQQVVDESRSKSPSSDDGSEEEESIESKETAKGNLGQDEHIVDRQTCQAGVKHNVQTSTTREHTAAKLALRKLQEAVYSSSNTRVTNYLKPKTEGCTSVTENTKQRKLKRTQSATSANNRGQLSYKQIYSNINGKNITSRQRENVKNTKKDPELAIPNRKQKRRKVVKLLTNEENQDENAAEKAEYVYERYEANLRNLTKSFFALECTEHNLVKFVNRKGRNNSKLKRSSLRKTESKWGAKRKSNKYGKRTRSTKSKL